MIARVGSTGRLMRWVMTIALSSGALLLMAGTASAAPTISTETPRVSDPFDGSVQFKASLDDNSTAGDTRESLTYYFEYGTTNSYGSQTPLKSDNAAGGWDFSRPTETATNLEWNKKYYVRVVAVKDGTEFRGNEMTFQTPPGDADGDGVKDNVDLCPSQPGLASRNGCPDDGRPDHIDAPPDADGDGTADSADMCPTLRGSHPGCPPPGSPTFRTDPVQITPQGVLFKASGNLAGNNGYVMFEISLFEDFQPRGSVDGSGKTMCKQKTGVKDIDGRDRHAAEFLFYPYEPREAWYRDGEVTCLSDPKVEDKSIMSAGRKLYVRAILGQDLSGGVQSFVMPGGGGGGGGTSPSEVSALSAALTPSGKAAKLGQILQKGGYTAPLKCPSAGTAAVTWSTKVKGKTVVVASGAASCTGTGGTSRKVLTSAASGSSLKIALTKQGKALLKKAKSAKLTTQTSFTPKGGKKVSVNGKLTLKR